MTKARPVRDRGKEGSTVGALLIAIVFAAGLLRVASTAADQEGAATQVIWLLGAITLVLYGSLTVLLVHTRASDPRARLFALTAIAVGATIVFDTVPLPEGGGIAMMAYVLLAAAIYSLNPPIILHMCASIPHMNRLLRRRMWVLRAAYAVAMLQTITLFLLMWSLVQPFMPWQLDPAFVHEIRVRSVVTSYAAMGLASLCLLGYAASREPTAHGRRQALVVFAGLLPWTLNMTVWFRWPQLAAAPASRLIHEITVLLPPVALFVSIAGYRLFEVGSVLRRTLIYGGPIGLALGLSAVGLDVADGIFAHNLGMPLAGWGLGVLLLLAGILGQPLIAKAARRVDRLFFPEREALGALRRRLIPELAGLRTVDAVGSYLTRELSGALHDAPVVLLLADSSEGFFRSRAAARASGPTAGIAAEWLFPWMDHLRRGSPFTRDPARETGALRAALDASQAMWIVPVSLNARPIGLVLLGESGAWKLETAEMELLGDIARQTSAMLENVRLLDLATTDPLTRLPRRHVAEERIAFELDRSRRTGRPFGVALVDVDHFKRINDTFGHVAGDLVLQRIAQTLAASSRRTDLVARWGGEEFVLLFAETYDAGSLVHAEALRTAVAALEIQVEDDIVRPTISIGLCTDAGNASDASEILIRVDAAMYRAKQQGRNRVVECQMASTAAEI
jgi:diguanylate cyclase (GGDEF)-like protein